VIYGNYPDVHLEFFFNDIEVNKHRELYVENGHQRGHVIVEKLVQLIENLRIN
jgi:hypothetical protein